MQQKSAPQRLLWAQFDALQMGSGWDEGNVMLMHKGQATRVGFKMDGDKKVRFAKKTGEVID